MKKRGRGRLDVRNRIIVTGNAIGHVGEVQGVALEVFPSWDVSVCRATDQLEDVFYGQIYQQVFQDDRGVFGHGRTKRKRARARTLPRLVLGNGFLRDYSVPMATETVETDAVRSLCYREGVTYMGYSAVRELRGLNRDEVGEVREKILEFQRAVS